VVVAFPLPVAARTRLTELVGDEVEVVDVRDADGSEGIVIVPSVSRQLIAKLGAAFPAARIVVIELEDVEHGVRLGGPVSRALKAGADSYYVAGSVEQFATLLGRMGDNRTAAIDVDRPAELTATERHLEDAVEVILSRRQQGERARLGEVSE
jgi:hypothetical protein